MSRDAIAISALSRDRFIESLNEEIMVQKNTGEFLIKSPDGEILSYDKINRINLTLKKIEEVCIENDFRGDIYKVDIDTFPMPNRLINGMDILADETNKIQIDTSSFLLYLDVDRLKADNRGFFEIVGIDPDVTLEITSTSIEGVITHRPVKLKLSEVNNTVFNRDEYKTEDTDIITISQISVSTSVDIGLNFIISGIYLVTL